MLTDNDRTITEGTLSNPLPNDGPIDSVLQFGHT